MKNQSTLNQGKQIFENYTAEDQRVWETLLRRQMKHQENFSRFYLQAMEDTDLDVPALPQFTRINTTLQKSTGWSLVGVKEFVPLKDFFAFMKERKFPCTTWLRGLKNLDYIEEPDMFHDVFGHVPLLSNSDFARFLQYFGAIALRHAPSPEILTRFQRLYWFTVEFGLIRENNQVKAYGAGIISSPKEVLNFKRKEVLIEDFNVEKVVNTSFRTDVVQSQYFIIDSFDQLYHSLKLITE